MIAWSIHTNGLCSAWSISHLIADIQDLAMSFVSCNFSWISGLGVSIYACGLTD